jgi:hypothetical protein
MTKHRKRIISGGGLVTGFAMLPLLGVASGKGKWRIDAKQKLADSPPAGWLQTAPAGWDHDNGL